MYGFKNSPVDLQPFLFIVLCQITSVSNLQHEGVYCMRLSCILLYYNPLVNYIFILTFTFRYQVMLG